MSNALYGKGTISPMKDSKGNPKKGKWRIYFSHGVDQLTGKPLRHTEVFTGTYRQAELRIEELRREYAGGKAPNADKITYAELSADWLNARERRVKRGDLRPSTLATDKRHAKHLVRALGTVRVSEIKPYTVAKLYRSFEESGIGKTELHGCHKQLKMVLDYAERNEIISRNPIDKMDRNDIPKAPVPDRTGKVLNEEQAARFCRAALGEPVSGFSMALILGMDEGTRRGEILGFTWAHAHLDGERPYLDNVQQFTKEGQITLRKTDRTGRPFGDILPLSYITADLLRVWKEIQAQRLAELAEKLNDKSFMQTENTPICSNTLGGFYNVDNFGRDFRRFCVRHGFGRLYDEEGREIVRVDLDESGQTIGEPPEGAHIEYYDSKGLPVDEHGRRYSRTNKRPEIKKHYKGFTPHGMRHTHYTLQYDKTDGKTLQYQGGWKSMRMLNDIYAHPVEANIWNAPGFLDSRLPGAE